MLTWKAILRSGGVRMVCARTSGNQQWRKQSQVDSLGFERKDKGSLRERGSKIWVACPPGGTGVSPCKWLTTPMCLVLVLFCFSSVCVLSAQQFPFYLKTSWPRIFVKDNMDE